MTYASIGKKYRTEQVMRMATQSGKGAALDIAKRGIRYCL